ncbi:MAG: AAA family ATPase [Vicinamibacteria bacterium]|nr:AAA family ATPase [Vicinamibacteria bacterium]
MKAIPTSAAAQTLLSLANGEACLAGREEIAPLHVLLTLLKLADDALDTDLEGAGVAPDVARELRAQGAEARAVLGMDASELTRLRRKVRRAARPDDEERPIRRLSLAASTRELLEAAAPFALEGPALAIAPVHLLRAMLQAPPPDVAPFLDGHASPKVPLEWETRIDEFVARFALERVTLVLTDMEGSMAIKRRYGDVEAARIFRAHDNVFRDLLQAHPGGREIKTIGDAFLLAFSAEEDAVRFCLAVQARLRAHKDLAQVGLKVRMGMFAGPVLSKAAGGSGLSDPLFGITIDTASRISSLAAGNQVLTDRGVHDAAREGLAATPPADLGPIEWRSHGLYKVKGLDEPVEVFEVGEIGQAAFVKPPASDKAAPYEPGAPHASSAAPVEREPEPRRRAALKGELGAPLGRDLTELARAGRLSPVIGRQAEMRTLARYLQRTSKRNVLLVGDAGVGKTALVEGFAQRLVAPDAREVLRRLRIVELRVSDLVAGTRYRGDLEQRLKGLLSEACEDPDLVLFLDEIHLVMGAGGGEGAIDVANILKPALARDDFRCIGATTTEEFERHVKGEAAFVRRFQLLRLGEPSEAEALAMCETWARRIEERQHVQLAPEAIAAAVTLSARLLPARRLPDKAIDLLENAAAAACVSSLSEKEAAPAKQPPRVGPREIEAVLEEQYGIAVTAAGALDADRAAAALRRALVGQEPAIAAIRETLAAAATRDPASPRPLAVLLFSGPTGVGKTLAAETLARALFDAGGRALGRFNMSEYGERHDLARLSGAPPGFVGHEEPGALFRFTEGHPQGLILLDEMEKAAPGVADWFLQVFDQGQATDSRGRCVDFRRHLFVLTCNAPQGEGTIGFVGSAAGEAEPGADGHLERAFRPEFLARIDRVVAFAPLAAADYEALLERQLAALAAELDAHGGGALEVEPALRERLVAEGLAQAEGARGFLRRFERAIGGPVRTRARGLERGVVVRARLSGEDVELA